MKKCEWYEQSSAPNTFAIFGENCERYWHDDNIERKIGKDFSNCPYCGEKIILENNMGETIFRDLSDQKHKKKYNKVLCKWQVGSVPNAGSGFFRIKGSFNKEKHADEFSELLRRSW